MMGTNPVRRSAFLAASLTVVCALSGCPRDCEPYYIESGVFVGQWQVTLESELLGAVDIGEWEFFPTTCRAFTGDLPFNPMEWSNPGAPGGEVGYTVEEGDTVAIATINDSFGNLDVILGGPLSAVLILSADGQSFVGTMAYTDCCFETDIVGTVTGTRVIEQ